jgi:hypothetical protein
VRRDLEHRLQALETRWFGSPKIAAYHRACRAIFEEALIRAISKEELIRAIEEAKSGMDDALLRDFSWAELERAMKDGDRALRAHIPFDGAE